MTKQQMDPKVADWEKRLYDAAGFLKYADRFGQPIEGILEPLAASLASVVAEMQQALEEIR